jgi:branched-chain amino acid transport system permease protein
MLKLLLSFSTEFLRSPIKYFKAFCEFRDSPNHLVPAFLLAAVLYGTFFALMAMGLTLTYMTTKVPNFAYGSFVTIGLYTAYQLSTLNHITPYWSCIIAFFVSGISSVVMYMGVLRPLARRGTPLVGQMIATFGVDIGFIGIFGIYTDYLQTRYRLVDAKQFYYLAGDFNVNVLGQEIQGVVFVAPLILALITLAIYLLFTKTRFGIAMRASVENASLARVLGINVERVYVASWMIAGGFAGIAGAIYTLALPGGTSTGSDLIVEIFASSILGGLTSIFGAVLGGLVIGGSEDIVTTELSQGFGFIGTGVIAVIIILLGILVFRKRKRNLRVLGIILALIGVYIMAEMATGFVDDLFVAGLVNGFQSQVIPFQKGIPLLIMVITLLVLPQGLVSLNWKRLRRSSR